MTTKTLGRHTTNDSRNTSPLARADHAGRVWGGRQVNQGVEHHRLPRTDKKWKPRPGSKRFGNGPKQAKAEQAWKFWDMYLGKYIYASSKPKNMKGWSKA